MPSKSNYPDIDVPEIDLWQLMFERRDRQFPDKKIIYRDPKTNESYTYTQVKSLAVNFGKFLKSGWNWQKGDVVALYAPNCIDIPSTVWGAHWAGGVVSPVNTGYTTDELVFQLRDSQANALVTHVSCLDIALAAAKAVGIPEDRILLVGDGKDKNGRFLHFRDLLIHLPYSSQQERSPSTNPMEDLAFLVYSSGTTGLPKGVKLSHTNIVANVLMINTVDGKYLSPFGGVNGEGDRMLTFLPLYHIYGLVCCVHLAMYNGSELAVMQKFDLEDFCSHVQDLKITFATVVPPVLLLLAKHPIIEKYDFSSLRMLSSGAAPLTKDLIATAHKRIKVPVRQGYGLSETSPATHVQGWKDWDASIGSVGLLLPNQVAKYVSPQGEEVPAGQTGELWIKGPNIFLGYHNNIAATNNALTEDGYLKTGDVGHQDKDGYFFITDRVKELIKYKGFQVPPAELEGLLLGHEDISDVAVIGIYDAERGTEVPRAYVVTKQGVEPSTATASRITQWLAERIANHKRLRGGVKFIDQVPKSPAGKILRRVLAEKAQKDQGPRL